MSYRRLFKIGNNGPKTYSLSSAMGWSGIGSILNYLGTILAVILIARGLSREDFGQLSYLVWVLSTVGSLAVLGIPYGTSVHVSGFLANSDYVLAKSAYIRGIRICVGLFIATAIAVMITARFFFSPDWPYSLGITLALFILAGIALTPVWLSWYSANLDYRIVAVTRGIASGVFLIMALITFLSRSPIVGLTSYAAKQAVPLLLIIPMSFWIIGWKPNENTSDAKTKRSLWALSWEQWLMLIGMTVVWARFEIVLLKMLASNSEIAYFNVSIQMVGPISMTVTLFTAPFGLFCARQYSTDGTNRIREVTGSLIRLAGVVSGLVAIVIVSLSPALLPALFGTEYTESARIVALLAFPAWIYCSISILSAVSQGIGRPLLPLLGALGAAPLFVGSAWLLIPLGGSAGAAIARIIGHMTSFAILWIAVARYVPKVLSFRDLIKLLSVVGFPLMILNVLNPLIGDAAVFPVCLFSVGWVILVCRWTGVLSLDDLLPLRRLFDKLPWWAEKPLGHMVSVLVPCV